MRVLVLLATLLALGACVPEQTTGPGPNPNPPVPPPQAETRPLPPVSEQQMIWRPGDWEWVGTGYVWQPGDWELLANHSNEFLPGHWEWQGTAWVWVRGHWM